MCLATAFSIIKCDGVGLMFDVSSFFVEAICTFITLNVDMYGYPLQDTGFSFVVQLFKKGNNITGYVGLLFLMASIADLENLRRLLILL
ncbi:hypothetical protein TNCV_3978931 [Trichonephila clavipes]|uniref:Uncharacterized protein n=1 Tax=Trichonephila clavipes TaxID=2585209 RepID=A0A8X6WG44_TRICX|nr:hypothetical protein TNCV_3978931 [Trichonephila clavipes]